MEYRERLQKINIIDTKAICNECGNILELGNFTYSGISKDSSTFREEKCICNQCKTPFIIRYDIFDSEGHIYPRVFSEDPNDHSYNWQDNLTQEQKESIAGHLKDCQICNSRLSNENLLDAWFADIIHSRKK